MNIIEFFESTNREKWLSQIRLCDWKAGPFLCELIDKDKFYSTLGESSKLFLLTDKDKLVSFCTLCEKDEIHDTQFTPWVGFVYTFPENRGKRCIGLLLDKALSAAKQSGYENVYISTDQIGLYEKYGFEFVRMMKTIYGGESRVYRKNT